MCECGTKQAHLKQSSMVAVRVVEIVVLVTTLSTFLGVLQVGLKIRQRRSLPATKQNFIPTNLNATTSDSSDGEREAYVALLYGDFVLGLRVLGQSLRESGTTRDYVALCMDDVPEYVRRVLRRDGWQIRQVDALPEECLGDDNNLITSLFTKLMAWALTDYNRLIYIDADAIVLHNIDHLFRCAQFCASYRHSDLFNSGVLVLKPSVEVFNDMCSKIKKCGTYTGGDQGFLNCYYDQLKYAPMFKRTGDNESNSDVPLMRLPSEYNADVGAYYLNSKWLYRDVEEPMILHYTLGPVKPWKWWTYPLFSLNWRWNSLRERLPPASDLYEPSMWDWPNLVPIVMFAIMYLTSKVWGKWYSQVVEHPKVVDFMMRFIPGKVTNLFPTMTLTMSFVLAFYCIPQTMRPVEAWVLYVLWIIYFHIFFYSILCHLMFVIGKQEKGTRNGIATAAPYIKLKCGASVVGFIVIYFLMVIVPIVLSTGLGRLFWIFLFLSLEYVFMHFMGQWFLSKCYHVGKLYSSLPR